MMKMMIMMIMMMCALYCIAVYCVSISPRIGERVRTGTLFASVFRHFLMQIWNDDDGDGDGNDFDYDQNN